MIFREEALIGMKQGYNPPVIFCRKCQLRHPFVVFDDISPGRGIFFTQGGLTLRETFFRADGIRPYGWQGKLFWNKKRAPKIGALNGDPCENRTRVTAVKGPCLNRLTNGP